VGSGRSRQWQCFCLEQRSHKAGLKNKTAAEPLQVGGVFGYAGFRSPGYCSGGFFSEPGFTERIQAMIFHRSSEVLIIPPKGGIGPTTTSCLTRL